MSEKPPVFLKRFAGLKNAAQFLNKYFPLKVVNAMCGVVSGLGLETGVAVPQWTKESSKQFWKYFVGDDFNATDSLEDFGVLLVLIEKFPEQAARKSASSIEKLLAKPAGKLASHIMQKEISDLSDEEKVQLYTGRARAKKIIQNLDNPDFLKMVKIADVYLIFAAKWEMFQSLDSQSEGIRWLRSEKHISENITDREIYQALQRIGFPKQGGRENPIGD